MKKLFLGIKGHVVCLDKQTGREIWRKKLRSSTLTNIVFDGDTLHAYCRGHLYSLNPHTGDILWENQLHGLGYGYCMIASEDAHYMSQAVSSAQAQQATASMMAASAASTAANS